VAYLVSLLLEESYLVRILGGETNMVVFHDKTNQFGKQPGWLEKEMLFEDFSNADLIRKLSTLFHRNCCL